MTDQPRSSGCLEIIFNLFGVASSDDSSKGGAATRLPYKQRDNFLSPAELPFYRVLEQTVGDRYAINNKVRLWDVLYMPRSEGGRKFENKISSKHIDFLLCDPSTMQPGVAIELDDASHAQADRQQRDDFVDNAFAATGLPILHISAARTCSITDIQAQINGLAPVQAPNPSAAPLPLPSTPPAPACPKCYTATCRTAHCKASGAAMTGCRVNDAYEIAPQIAKCSNCGCQPVLLSQKPV